MGFPDAELSLTLVSDAEIAELAGRFGRPARATDVLSFSLHEGAGPEDLVDPDLLGDVFISVETAERHAKSRRVSLDDELRDLVIHGTLHLLGMDHMNASDRSDMREVEAQLRWTLKQLE